MMKRLFIALPLEKTGLEELEKIASCISRFGSSLKMVPPQQYHITLKFLGDTPESRIDDIRAGLMSLRCNAIHYRLTGLGSFPNVIAPSVIWAGMDADTVIKELAREVDDFTRELGFPSEKRTFSPHLTLARVRRDHTVPRELAELIKSSSRIILGEGTFRRLVLYESALSKTGPTHTELETLSLNGE